MKRRRPPHLRLVGTEGPEIKQVDQPSPYPVLDSIKVAAAPLADAVRFMTDAAIEAVTDGAADFGFPPGDLDPLREKVRAVVVDFSIGWIAERLAEYRESIWDGDDPGH